MFKLPVLLFCDVPLLLIHNKAFYNSKMDCLCSYCYVFVYIYVCYVTSSFFHLAPNLSIHGFIDAIGIFIFQPFYKYLVRKWHCYLSATCGYTFSYSNLSSSYLFVTVHYWNFKLNLADYLWLVLFRR